MSRENYGEQMEFPNTWEEFELCYGFYDTNEVYTNGSRLIPSFRVKQWLEHQMMAESRMSFVREAVNTIMCTCNTDSIADKAMRNAARFVQNAIDGSYPDFEKLEKEPKMGRWIYGFMTADGHRMYRCSKCGWFLRQKHSGSLNRLKWCCSCGAKMQEVEE